MTIVRGLAVPEMVTKEAYGGIIAVPSAVARALAPVAAAALWSIAASYDAVLRAAFAMAVMSVASFWKGGAREARVTGGIPAAPLEAGLTSAERRCNPAKR